MAATIPSLWPDDIKVDVVPPVVILRYQAAKIGELTNGIIRADVTTTTGQEDFVVHRLELIAPLLDGRRYVVLTVTHRSDFYPVVLEADCYRPRRQIIMGVTGDLARVTAALSEVVSTIGTATHPWPNPGDWRPIAPNQDEFYKRVGEVLKSMEVRSAIDSLIALSNQRRQPSEGGEQGSNGTAESPPTNEETRP